MELLECHFSNIKNGNLYFDKTLNTYEMFSYKGIPMHLNYLTFKELFKNMGNLKNPQILETGIASAGTQSTYLFNEYIRKYGGRFWSVDINDKLVDMHSRNMCPATTLMCGDSVAFIKNWVSNNSRADVVYLDSYDLDFYNPHPSAQHGLNEYTALLPVLKENSLLLIDDTPKNPYWLDCRNKLYQDMTEYYIKNNELPGKGQYILREEKDATILLHNYQVLYKF
jgi:hypothetical protein